MVVSGINTTGSMTGCSAGPTCTDNSNGNGMGFEINITSYSAPTYSGTSGTNNVVTAAYKEAASGTTCNNRIALLGAGCS